MATMAPGCGHHAAGARRAARLADGGRGRGRRHQLDRPSELHARHLGARPPDPGDGGGRPEREDQGGGRLLHPRRRGCGARGRPGARADVPAAGRRPLARRERQPRRRSRRDARRRPRRRPQPQLPLALAQARQAHRALVGAAPPVGAGEPGARRTAPPGAAEARALVPPGARGDRPVRRQPRVRAGLRGAVGAAR